MAASRIFLVAGEQSGDNLGAALIGALRARRPELEFFGIAGPAMRAAGCQAVGNSEALAVMGLVEVLSHLPRLWRLRRAALRAARAGRAEVFIGIDSPEFNLSLARELHRRGVATVQYVSPQVWAWRGGRVTGMARILDLVLCLLPFEPEFYARARLPARFVGHPLADQIPMEPDRAAARVSLALPAGATVLALLPGSRRAEVQRLAADFLAAASWLDARRPGLLCIAPAANASARALLERAALRFPELPLRITDGQAQTVLAASDVVLVASGTAALETLLSKRPMVVAYRVGWVTAWLLRRLRLIKSAFFAQPNLLAGRLIVPELAQEAVTPERLGREALAWLEDPARTAASVAEFRRIHALLARGAAAEAASAVLELIDARPA
jgi:lipid-A-disaccharide synthase